MNTEGLSARHTNSLKSLNYGRLSLGRQFTKQWMLLLLVLPALLCYVIFAYLPMLGIIAAFQDYRPYWGFLKSPFVGFKWFVELFNSPDFGRVVIYTVYMSIMKLICGFPAPVIFALLLNELTLKRFKKSVQTLSYLPHFLSWVVVSIIVYRLLDANDGIVINILSQFGIHNVNILAEPKYFLSIAVISDIWKEVGFGSIFYLAALTSIDPALYEAANVDGARKFRQLIHITLPGITPIIIMMLILSMGGLVGANFDQVYNLQNPIIQQETEVINTYIFRKAILGGAYSFSTAFGLAQGLVSFALLLITNAASKKLTDVGIY